MNVTWGLLTVLGLVWRAESRCSPTAYYKNCWIRRFPGIFIDIEESQRRGAQLLRQYQEETALKCSRTCCLTRNFSCNLAIFHYDATQENMNCFHLHCPTLESCILSHRGNVVLYNVTKGVDPDLLVFGKYFTSNVRVLPHHYSRFNASEPLPSDKRQFIHPPPPAAPPPPTVKAPTTSGRAPTTNTITTTQSTASTSPPALSPPETPLVSGTSAQTTTTSTSTASLAPTSPFSSTTPTTLSPSIHRETTPVFSTQTAEPSASPSQIHTTVSTFSPSATSPPTPTTSMSSIDSSKQYPNDTKGNQGRNHSAAGGDGEQDIGSEDSFGGLEPGWHVAAHTLLVAVAICITVLLSCCCSVVLVVSWRGQRKRMGRYRTSWRGKRGSMRLIKYVLVRENT